MRAEGIIRIGIATFSMVLFAACGTSTGGGFVGVQSGGQAGTVCNPQLNSEGCLYSSPTPAGYRRMVCDSTTDPAAPKWALKESCASGWSCIETGTNPKTTECKAPAVAPDVTTGDTAGDTTKPDTSGDTTVDPTNPSSIIACLKSSCPTEYAACLKSTACGPTFTCAEKCTIDSCADACPKPTEDETLIALFTCGQYCLQPVVDNCGNGTCDADETSASCPGDCPVTNKCGNGTCDAGETSASCPGDCPVTNKCGNGTCDAGETSATCPSDCPVTNKCGNGTCDAGETSATCPSDCPVAGSKCGDLTCQSSENASSCPFDCSSESVQIKQCLTGLCSTEWQACSKDSGCGMLLNCLMMCSNDSACTNACVAAAPSGSMNKVAAVGQCVDAKCTVTTPSCGDGTCDAGETAANCAADCGSGGDQSCVVKATAGCPGCKCELCVCNLDPFCCETAWDDTCVGECTSDCNGNCP